MYSVICDILAIIINIWVKVCLKDKCKRKTCLKKIIMIKITIEVF